MNSANVVSAPES